MKLLYFAWLRAKIGTSEETVELPAEVATVGHLLEWLKRDIGKVSFPQGRQV